MAVSLGKRKRRGGLDEASTDTTASDSDAQAIFRRHFEARFKPLPETKRPVPAAAPETENEEDVDENSEWSGIDTEAEGDASIQVIEHSSLNDTRDRPRPADVKAFMSSKPPTSKPQSAPTADLKLAPAAEDAAEAAHLKNDMALQRLLKESHLLDPSRDLSASGTNRHKAIDLRLQALGAKESILKQKNMPMARQVGMAAKAQRREENRRREARENGVVLEKAVAVGKGRRGARRREEGVGEPAVGRFSGGTLRLSRRDVAAIEGPRGGRRGRGRERGRR